MILSRIGKIKDYRIFRDFNWPADLHDFGQFNVIYGWNGAGKTTLSTILRHLEKRRPIVEGRIDFIFGDRVVNGTNLGTEPVPSVRVFNRDFVGRAVFESNDTHLPPVYYFGEDSVEKQQRIVVLRAQLNEQKTIETNQLSALRLSTQSLENFCTEQAKSIRLMLTVSGGGTYNNYDARSFKQQIQKLIGLATLPERLTEEERDTHLKMRESKALPALQEISVRFPDLVSLRTRTESLLRASVVSTVLDDLAADQAVASWVGEGLALHSGQRSIETCRFCDQPLPAKRITQIEAHFNDEFKRLKQQVSALLNEVEQASAFGNGFSAPPVEALYEALQDEYASALSELQKHSKTLQGALDALKHALLAKLEDPFKQIELSSWLQHVGQGGGLAQFVMALFAFAADGAPFVASFAGAKELKRLNATLAKHNLLTSSFDASVKAARDALAQDEVLAALEGWKEKSWSVAEGESVCDVARQKARELETEIAALEVEIRQHHRPADELNAELAGYLGRSELKLVAEHNGYRIVRNGHPAMHLSDGERTAVAFMYFLKSLQGTDFVLEDGIVVIDDPVSSLDSNSLFSAFGFLKERTASAKQLFILTHNFAFFRQVRNWFDSVNKWGRKRKGEKPARFFSLSPVLLDGQRAAKLETLDPFLTDFESEYHYLFKRVYDLTQLDQGDGLEQYYSMPNMARRLLEAFLAYRVPGYSGDLHKKLQLVAGDTGIKTRVLRFLHTFSHGDAVAQPDHDPSILAETQAVLKDVLQLISQNDQAHYEAMVRLLDEFS
ncbi:AAA family ATPase [Vogesella sp. DC21W]|uniref:AAA family ATPase n=1 Tax=Vogesella aquatica TaxID=2984206 RepID=A0ABT5J1C2_9NEIS|nr:AAA family ATPase [Vogesella aquatica]MDC7718633.1 AAA family ATPase [Vogesella aquatica]